MCSWVHFYLFALEYVCTLGWLGLGEKNYDKNSATCDPSQVTYVSLFPCQINTCKLFFWVFLEISASKPLCALLGSCYQLISVSGSLLLVYNHLPGVLDHRNPQFILSLILAVSHPSVPDKCCTFFFVTTIFPFRGSPSSTRIVRIDLFVQRALKMFCWLIFHGNFMREFLGWFIHTKTIDSEWKDESLHPFSIKKNYILGS